jgi:ubiquinone/menaquinone biosynthesis C-methylase UbiE
MLTDTFTLKNINQSLRRFFKETFLFNYIKVANLALRREILDAIKSFHLLGSAKVLDVGCVTRPYENYFPVGSYFGVDVEVSGRSTGLKKPDQYYNGHVLPCEDNSWDCVLCSQVLEHVPIRKKYLVKYIA